MLAHFSSGTSMSRSRLELNDGHGGQCRRCPHYWPRCPQKIPVFTASLALPPFHLGRRALFAKTSDSYFLILYVSFYTRFWCHSNAVTIISCRCSASDDREKTRQLSLIFHTRRTRGPACTIIHTHSTVHVQYITCTVYSFVLHTA